MEYTVNCTYTPIVLKGFRPLQWLKETVHMGEKKKKLPSFGAKNMVRKHYLEH
jgi:hypothetical protein